MFRLKKPIEKFDQDQALKFMTGLKDLSKADRWATCNTCMKRHRPGTQCPDMLAVEKCLDFVLQIASKP